MSSHRLRWLVSIYVALLLASYVVRYLHTDPTPNPLARFDELQAVGDGERPTGTVRVAFYDLGPEQPGPWRPAVLLIHGSPGNKENFDGLLPQLAAHRRVIVPDLPGFGDSEHDVPDYSVEAHAIYLERLLRAEKLGPVHVVGYSMGGGVALELVSRLSEDEYRSLTLLASIGVQELELLGDRRLNRFVHAGQLVALWTLHNLVPHFGLLDDTMLNVPYARNFYDTDQRPLRGILQQLRMPTLVLHGTDDFLVSPEAAIEHHRLVPQSELQMIEGFDHFMPFTQSDAIAARLGQFFDRVDAGEVAVRDDALPDRIAAAARPFDPAKFPDRAGLGLVVMILLIAAATLVSEDLTCIGVGLMVSQGRIEFLPGTFACFLGIFVGDLLLYLAGRVLGRAALKQAPLRWWIGNDQVDAAGEWFRRRGAIVILLSRFMPGARLPTYFAAGTLRTGFFAFAAYFFLAVALWTPLLVALAMVLGEQAFHSFAEFERYSLWLVPLLAVWILILVKGLLPLMTHRGRRRLTGTWNRWTRWEFWPPWLFYPPVVLWISWLGAKYRGPLLFTAANPAIPASGFIDESKAAILDGLTADPANRSRIAPYLRLAAETVALRYDEVCSFMVENRLDYPVVLKPDAGQRGSGVAIVLSPSQVQDYLIVADYDVLVQAYVPGVEFGLFWYRMPGDAAGELFSITEKIMPELIGDGLRSIEELIYDDRRAVTLADHYIELQQEGPLHTSRRVPRAGERIRLTELGTHCLGAIFLDGASRRSDALETELDRIGNRYEGFYFGRYDVRCNDAEALARGEFTVVELNGVTSEATHIYDPRHGLFDAYRTLFHQWEIAFRIGAANRDRGAYPTGVGELCRALLNYRRQSRGHGIGKRS